METESPLQPIPCNLRTVEEMVLEQLREAIICGQFKPGNKLKSRDLARDLGVSSMPVRRALTTLEAEGLVRHEPHRPFEVTSATLDEAETIYLCRCALEALAVELAAAECTEEDLRSMCEAFASMDEAVGCADFPAFRRADDTFHDALNQACRRPFLIKLIWELRQRARRYRYLYHLKHRSVQDMQRMQIEHGQIVEAMAEGDGSKAAKIVTVCLKRTCRMLREEVERHRAGSSPTDSPAYKPIAPGVERNQSGY